MYKAAIILSCITTWITAVKAQDTLPVNLIPSHAATKYFTGISNKAERYKECLTSKTEKTLEKLCKWEDKVKAILEKVNPEKATELFSGKRPTFNSLLQSIRNGESVADNYQAAYNKYLDDVNTQTAFILQQKDKISESVMLKSAEAQKNLLDLDSTLNNTEAIEMFIKERKKELMQQCAAYLANSKQLQKINKEIYYYTETLKNYKEIFSDTKKAEETAMKLLNKLPAFQNFMQRNSELASLFGVPGSETSVTDNLTAGLQTRESVLNTLQNNFSGGPNPQQYIQEGMAQAQEQMNTLKEKISNAGAGSSDDEVPDFKINTQRSKTFLQRIEFGTNLQFQPGTDLLPAVADIALQAGYKLNTRSIVGIGASYKMGYGSLQHIAITHQGIGMRSYIDWKIKKEFYLSGGYEMNYNAAFRNIDELKNTTDLWQQSGLIGLSKRIEIKTKWFSGTKVQLLYDLLHQQQTPPSHAFIFRVGYTFSH